MRPRTIDSLPLPPAMWHVSADGYDLLKKFENCRLESYRDPAGIETIGYGHRNDRDGLTRISENQAIALLKLDSMKALACLRNSVKRRMFQNQVDACVSLIFNIGCEAWLTSHLLPAVEADDRDAVEAQWMRWDHIGKKVSKGLMKRRAAELALYCEVPF